MSESVEIKKISNISKYDEEIEKIENSGIKVYKLNIGQPDLKTDESYYKALKKIKSSVNCYGDYRGNEELRIEFADYYNEKVNKNKFNKDNIQITIGASDAIISILMSICSAGDKILVIEPFFSDYKMYCKLLNIEMIPISIKELENEKVEKRENCKAILFSNPNNPSGYILNNREIKLICNLALRNNLYIISDEVYNEIVYEEFISFASIDLDNIIIVDSMSKKFNNCGARIGAIITQNSSIISSISTIYDARISISNSEQIACTKMLKNRAKIFKKNLKEYYKRKQSIEEFLKKYKFIKYKKPKGGIFFLLELPIDDATKFAEWLLRNYRNKKRTVLVLPAEDFFFLNNKNKVRISISNNARYTIEALEILVNGLKEYILNRGNQN